MTDLQRAFNDAAAQPDAPDPAAQAWALWFDCLREHVNAARNMHPLRHEELFDDAA